MACFSSLVLVVCENHGSHQVKELHSHKRLADEGALLTNYFSITHPSGPNYRSLVAGQYFTRDEYLDQEKPSFASLASLPIFVWHYKGVPARRHNPFLDLKNSHEKKSTLDIEQLPERCVLYVGMDDDNNAHSGPLAVADSNLEMLIDRLSASSWFNRPVGGLYPLLFVTWDEAYTASNQVFAALWGRGVIPGSQCAEKLNHYSFCRLCCENFAVEPLAHAADATRIEGIWTI